jgi:hypothetical protein
VDVREWGVQSRSEFRMQLIHEYALFQAASVTIAIQRCPPLPDSSVTALKLTNSKDEDSQSVASRTVFVLEHNSYGNTNEQDNVYKPG